jgi:hypothetical protein
MFTTGLCLLDTQSTAFTADEDWLDTTLAYFNGDMMASDARGILWVVNARSISGLSPDNNKDGLRVNRESNSSGDERSFNVQFQKRPAPLLVPGILSCMFTCRGLKIYSYASRTGIQKLSPSI